MSSRIRNTSTGLAARPVDASHPADGLLDGASVTACRAISASGVAKDPALDDVPVKPPDSTVPSCTIGAPAITGFPVMAAAMSWMSSDFGNGRPIITSTSTSPQRSMPSMASKCATSTPSMPAKSPSMALIGDHQPAPPCYQMPARRRPAVAACGRPSPPPRASLAGRQRLQRRLADRQSDHLGDLHVRCLDVEIADKFEVRQKVLHDFERQRRVGDDHRQSDELVGNVLAAEQAQAAHWAVLGLDGFDLEAPGSLLAAGNQFVERPPHAMPPAQLPHEAELFDRGFLRSSRWRLGEARCRPCAAIPAFPRWYKGCRHQLLPAYRALRRSAAGAVT